MIYVIYIGKIVADLLYESVFHQNNQFEGVKGFAVFAMLVIILLMELYLMSEMMRVFDAVLIIPIYNSLQILSTIALSGVYWDNFEDWSLKDSLLFTLGLVLIFGGIGTVSQGQKHMSMAHHVDDKRQKIIRANESGTGGKNQMKSFSGNVDVNDVVNEDLP